MSPERVRHGTAGPAVRPVVAGRDAVHRGRGPLTVPARLGDRDADRAGRRRARSAAPGRGAAAGPRRAAPQGSRVRTDVAEAERRLRAAATGGEVPRQRRRWRSERTYQAGAADAGAWAEPASPGPQPPSEPTGPATEVKAPDATAIRTAQPTPTPQPPPAGQGSTADLRDIGKPPNRQRSRLRAMAVAAAILILAAARWLATRSDPETSARDAPPPNTAGTTAAASTAAGTATSTATVAPGGSARATGTASGTPPRSPTAVRTGPAAPAVAGWLDQLPRSDRLLGVRPQGLEAAPGKDRSCTSATREPVGSSASTRPPSPR